MSTKNLSQIRARIAELQAEIARTEKAGLPRDETIAALRHKLQSYIGQFESVKTDIAAGIERGNPDMIAHSFPARLQNEIAIGASLASYGLDKLLSEADAQAGEDCPLRLSRAEQIERLRKLWSEKYELELAEETARGHEPRRAGANAAAVLGIPLKIAEQHGLTGFRERW